MSTPPSPDHFGVAIICALQNEADAVLATFDEIYEVKGLVHHRYKDDPNQYYLGKIGDHNVTVLRTAGMGKVRAANAAGSCRSTFKNVSLALIVGICGGVPEPPKHCPIFKGDVIVSTNVVQSDFGRQYHEGVVRKDTFQDNLVPHGLELRNFLHTLEGQMVAFRIRKDIDTIINEMGSREWFTMPPRPEQGKDYAFKAKYRHIHRDGQCPTCAKCLGPEDTACEISREASCKTLNCDLSERIDRTPNGKMSIHYGSLGSSDQVMKSSVHRDRIAAAEKIIGFEMEGAGVWEVFPTIVVKGVCYYADSHKDKEWQDYAAVRAAAAAKAILLQWQNISFNSDVADTIPQDVSDEVPFVSETRRMLPGVSGDRVNYSGIFLTGRDTLYHQTYSSDTTNFN